MTDAVRCAYCNKETIQYEQVDQIPEYKVPQEFILAEIYTFKGLQLKATDNVCMSHELCFELKYASNKHGGDFTRQYGVFNPKQACCYCQNHRDRNRPISTINQNFREFLLRTGASRGSRSGTGLSEAEILCHACYLVLRNKHMSLKTGAYYSPIKSPKNIAYHKPKVIKSFTSPPITSPNSCRSSIQSPLTSPATDLSSPSLSVLSSPQSIPSTPSATIRTLADQQIISPISSHSQSSQAQGVPDTRARDPSEIEVCAFCKSENPPERARKTKYKSKILSMIGAVKECCRLYSHTVDSAKIELTKEFIHRFCYFEYIRKSLGNYEKCLICKYDARKPKVRRKTKKVEIKNVDEQMLKKIINYRASINDPVKEVEYRLSAHSECWDEKIEGAGTIISSLQETTAAQSSSVQTTHRCSSSSVQTPMASAFASTSSVQRPMQSAFSSSSSVQTPMESAFASSSSVKTPMESAFVSSSSIELYPDVKPRRHSTRKRKAGTDQTECVPAVIPLEKRSVKRSIQQAFGTSPEAIPQVYPSTPVQPATQRTSSMVSSNDEIKLEVWATFIHYLKQELAEERPILMKKAFDDFNDLLVEKNEEDDIFLEEYSYGEFNRKIVEWTKCSNGLYKLNKIENSKKLGKLIYKSSWSMVDIIHKLMIQQSENESVESASNILAFQDSTPGVSWSDMLKALNTIRTRIINSRDLCRIYSRYPETLLNVSSNSLLTGQEVEVTNDDGELVKIKIPGVDPFLFNAMFYLTSSHEQSKNFIENFPGWETLYTDGAEINKYNQVIQLVFDLLHHQNQENCYPIHIMLTDIIANTNPSALIDILSLTRRCASSSLYGEFRNRVALLIKERKDAGNVPGLLKDRRTAIHMDNLEQYQKNALDPTKSLASSLVVGAQQPDIGATEIPPTNIMGEVLVPRPVQLTSQYPEYESFEQPCKPPDDPIHVPRQCKESDFTYEGHEDQEVYQKLVAQQLSNCLHRMVASEDEGQQIIPTLKEVLAWEQTEDMKATSTVYLELIPEKPNDQETILKAVSRVEKLFVHQLRNQHVMICGDGATVKHLYAIKDQYGESMKWMLPMLGTWHTIKDYLRIFFQKYRYAFLETVLKESFSRNTLENILKVSSWSRSHFYGGLVMEALMRLFIETIMQSGDFEESTILELKDAAKACCACLVSEEDLDDEHIQNFIQSHTNCTQLMAAILPQIEIISQEAGSSDKMFKLFANAVNDWLVYCLMYIAIRSGNWQMRKTGLKMIASRFVVSGATWYQTLVLRHLADLASIYPDEILEFLDKKKGWVSILRDGKMVCLARDEYHERTASLHIQLVMPRNPTPTNMLVVTQYLTYGAKLRKQFLEEVLAKMPYKPRFSKGCGKNFLQYQESKIQQYKKKLLECSPFDNANRELVQPFTNIPAKENVCSELLNGEDLGRQTVRAYIPRFCATRHTIPSENRPMRMKRLATFKPEQKKESKRMKIMKEERKVLQVLASSAIKDQQSILNPAESSASSIVGKQITELPLFFCNEDGTPFRRDKKTNIRESLETSYQNGFKHSIDIPKDDSVYILDSLQDIQMPPKPTHKTFGEYLDLFWDNKIKPSLQISNTVCLVFDAQDRGNSPKDATRLSRDTKGITSPDIQIADRESKLPQSENWPNFLRNRKNKMNLIKLITGEFLKYGDKLTIHQILYISFETVVWIVINGLEPKIEEDMANDHEEADSRIFFIANALQNSYNTILIQSTDSDLLFIYLGNESTFENVDVYILFSIGYYTRKYVDGRALVQCINRDQTFEMQICKQQVGSLPKLICLLHFLSGCDDLCHFRGVTKNKCLKAMLKYSEFIFQDVKSIDQLVNPMNKDEFRRFFIRFIVAVYFCKYSSCFTKSETPGDIVEKCQDTDTYLGNLLTEVRDKTWHMAVCDKITVPSLDAVDLRSQRSVYSLQKIFNCTNHYICKDLEMRDWGWNEDGDTLSIKWDSKAQIARANEFIQSKLKACKCKKSDCDPEKKTCPCRRGSTPAKCSMLCKCSIICRNRDVIKENPDVAEKDKDSVSRRGNTLQTDSDNESEESSDDESEPFMSDTDNEIYDDFREERRDAFAFLKSITEGEETEMFDC